MPPRPIPAGPGRLWIWALAGLFWASAGQAFALAGGEFLNLCAGERGRVSPAALKKALAEGANINFTGPRGLTPLMAFVSAHREADREALASLKVILQAGPDLEARSEEGGTALGYAILNRAGPRVIAALLAAGAGARTPLGPQGHLPPLLLAAGLEPDPLVSALLWVHGGGRGLPGSELLEQAKGRPEVFRLLKGALEAGTEEGLPLFAPAPQAPLLRARLKDMETRLKPLAEDLDHLQWHIDLPLNAALRRELMGRSEAEAWLDEYSFRLALAAGPPPPEPRPRDRVVLPGPRPPEAPQEALASSDRRVIVLVYASGLLVAHETASGLELWRRRPQGPTQLLPVGRLFLAATAWSGSLGEAVVLDPLTGAALLTLTDLDDPKWIVDAGRRALIISTDLTLDIFDLSSWKNRRWSWQALLENQGWDEARNSARIRQNRILAEYGERLDDEGRFIRPGGGLFQPVPVPRPMLDRARASLKARGYVEELSPLAVEKIPPPVFVLGPPCPDLCGPREAATPLVLVNPVLDRLDALTVPEPFGGRPLVRGRLEPDAGLKFSPGGTFLAATDLSGSLHFFAARDQGRYLGFLPPQTRLAGDTSARFLLRDLKLLALLTDDQPPLVLFHDPARDRLLLAEADLGGTLRPRPLEPGTAAGLTAFAAAPAGRWAAGFTDGSLWLLAPGRPAPLRLAPIQPPAEAEAPFSALAFSGNGQILAAASGRDIHLFKDGSSGPLKRTLAGEVTHLALDHSGRWLWAALDFDGPASGRLALVDMNGQASPVYQPVSGRILALESYEGRAVALTQPPPDLLEPPPPFRWAQGRADILAFDQRRPANPAALGLSEPDRQFAGLSLGEIFHQETMPGRPFVTLGRSALADGRPGRLTAAGPRRRLEPAAFDLSGRLAVFPESGGGSFYVYNLATGRELARGRGADPEGLLGAAFLRDPSRLLTFGRSGLIRLWSIKEPEPRLLLTWLFTADGRWAAVDPEGHFDTETPQELDYILWSANRGTAVPFNSLDSSQDNFRPGLAKTVLD